MKNISTKKIVFVGALVLLLIAGITIGYSVAYFTAGIQNSTINNSVVTSGRMEIEFTDGPEVSLTNAIPGTHIQKTFSVKNVGTVNTAYDIYLSDLLNTFEDKTDLTYTLTSTSGANVAETQMPDTPTKIVNQQAIGVNVSHNYTLRIDFKETNDDQNDNKGKKFSTIIRINEVKDYVEPVKSTQTIKNIVKDDDDTTTDIINKGTGTSMDSYTLG